VRTMLAAFSGNLERLHHVNHLIRQRIQGDLDKNLSKSRCQSWTECERILVTLGIVAIHVLEARGKCIGTGEFSKMVSRPWLRHLWWEGCLAYIVWDIIPICERRELYCLAIQALNVPMNGSLSESSEGGTLASILLLRRARGKALDRLVIDKTNLARRQCTAQSLDRNLRKQALMDMAAEIAEFCQRVLKRVVKSGQITFAAIRGVARRLKHPLYVTLNSLDCLEAKELGLRLGNNQGELASRVDDTDCEQKKSYSDWTPITDTLRQLETQFKQTEVELVHGMYLLVTEMLRQ
jgi:hypothetical protein